MKRLVVTTALTVTALICALSLTGWPAAASTTSGANVPEPGGPIVRAPSPGASPSGQPAISYNWSGYVATSSRKFTYVQTRFIQPALKCNGGANQWTSDWSGLDGWNTGTVEQDGTFAACLGPSNRTPQYFAWYELFPAAAVLVYHVRAGDTIDSSVRYANGKFTLVISDLTLGKSVTHTAACSDCARASAEWIIERPGLCNNAGTKCFLTKLANFGRSTLGLAQAQVAGGLVTSISHFANIPIYMITPLKKGFISLDTVGPLSRSGAAFTVTWDRYGNTVPLTL